MHSKNTVNLPFVVIEIFNEIIILQILLYTILFTVHNLFLVFTDIVDWKIDHII